MSILLRYGFAWLFLFVFELDGFLGVALGILDLYYHRIVVALGLDTECGFFQWITILILQIPIVIPINTACGFLVKVFGR